MRVLGFVILVIPIFAAAARADDAPPVADLPVCSPSDPDHEKADVATLAAAKAAFDKGGFTALAGEMPALEEALTRAPAHEVEMCGGEVIVRSSQLVRFLELTAVLQKKSGVKHVVWSASPYIGMALYAGAAHVENSEWPQADAALSKGLAIDPENPELTNEEALALVSLKRADDAVALCERVISENLGLDEKNHARLLRTKGFALEDLQRLDDAAAAYQESLKLDPDNPTALNELKYIAHLKEGGASVPASTLHSNTGKPVQPGD